jgi:heptose-I-phosphate ethanolaminephosphotransferase
LGEYFCRKDKVRNWVKTRSASIRKYLPLVLLFVLVYGLCSTKIYWKVRNAETPDDVRLMYAPTDPLSSIYTSLLTLHMMEENMEDAIEINKTVYETEDVFITEDEPLNIVLVIGESYIKCHSQLYGYYLQTTPNMQREQQEGRLFVFNDVISTSNATSVVMKNVFSCNNSGTGEQWYDFPAFLTIFKKAGYNVYFWDNQRDFDSMATYSFTLNSFLYDPELQKIMYTKTNDEVYTYDGGLVESFNENFDVDSAKHNLILLHLQGQHLTPTSRFPQGEFERFTADSIKRDDSFLTYEMKEYIAGYDNATLYNDYVMDMVFDTFKESNTMVIYFSDHGEEVYDYRKQCGRDHGEINSMTLRYQYEVPFMIWCSDIYMEKNPDVVNSIRQAVNRPFVNDNLSHMLFNIGGISTTYYREDFDLLSPNYRCEQRRVKGNRIYEEER